METLVARLMKVRAFQLLNDRAFWKGVTKIIGSILM